MARIFWLALAIARAAGFGYFPDAECPALLAESIAASEGITEISFEDNCADEGLRRYEVYAGGTSIYFWGEWQCDENGISDNTVSLSKRLHGLYEGIEGECDATATFGSAECSDTAYVAAGSAACAAKLGCTAICEPPPTCESEDGCCHDTHRCTPDHEVDDCGESGTYSISPTDMKAACEALL